MVFGFSVLFPFDISLKIALLKSMNHTDVMTGTFFFWSAYN